MWFELIVLGPEYTASVFFESSHIWCWRLAVHVFSVAAAAEVVLVVVAAEVVPDRQ